MYSTNVRLFKIVKNTPIFLGEAFGLSESSNLDYLTQCLKTNVKYTTKISRIVDDYRKGKHNIVKL